MDDIKKLKMLGKILIWKSNNKIHVKDLDKPEEHGTIGLLKDGKLDIHRKNEKSNTYQSEGILDLKKFMSKLIKNPEEILSPLLEFSRIMKPVNFDEDNLSHLFVAPFIDKNSLSPYMKKKKNEFDVALKLERDKVE